MTRRTVSSGSPWEQQVGYCRAVRVGNLVFVSGTTASDVDGRTVAVGDAYAQAKFALRKIQAALEEAGATLQDVVRTRIFVTDIGQWQDIGRAHAECFAGPAPPAATMVEVARLINEDHLVEIEADAVLVGRPNEMRP